MYQPEDFDPEVYARRRVAETVPEMAWKAGTTPQMRGWQTRLRRRLNAALGGLPWERVPLAPEVVEVRLLDDYRRETIYFQSRPGLAAFGYFLVPNDCALHRPAVLCLPGHGRGVDSLVGIAEDGGRRALGAPDEYQQDFALQCVARGFPVFALEQISFGHRRSEAARQEGSGSSSCRRDSMAALMLGETMAGWRVWDALRALDYLETRPEVDKGRLAVMGISGGGMTALFAAALDTRIRAAVVSGYFNTFAASILSIDHCPDNYVPGLQTLVEMPDFAGLIAPRALFVEGGRQDPIFPVSALQTAIERAREIYAAFGCPQNFDAQIFEGGHEFHGREAFPFLEKHLC